MKKAIFFVLVALFTAVLFWMLKGPCCTKPSPPRAVSTPPEATVAPPAQVAAPSTSDVTQEIRPREEASPGPAEEATPTLSPQQSLESLKVTFNNYGQRFKGNPVGNNAEITAALNGKNPQQVRFLGDAPHLNEKGELLDGWGTPYFFHQLGGYDMEIHSAGPDRKMWTTDDLVTR